MRFDWKQLKSKRYLLALLTVFFVIVGFFVQRKISSSKPHSEETTNAGVKEELQALSAKVAASELESYVKAPGVINFHPKYAARIHSSFPGIVLRANKNLGDRVAAGEVLAVIESNVGIQNYSVTSPISGVVLSKSVSEGQSVSPENELLSVGNMDFLQARLSVSAKDVKTIQAGQVVLLFSDEQQITRSDIGFISPVLSEDTRTATAIVDFKPNDLRPGMFVTAAIVTSKTPIAKSLPKQFKSEGGRDSKLYVLNQNSIEERVVKFGVCDYEKCEVIDGLNVGDAVVKSLDVAAVHSDEEEEHDHDHDHDE